MTKRLPLWQAMDDGMDAQASREAGQTDPLVWRRIRAAEIRALRDWLFPAGRPGDDSCCDVMQAHLWVRLTKEAGRAERGDG